MWFFDFGFSECLTASRCQDYATAAYFGRAAISFYDAASVVEVSTMKETTQTAFDKYLVLNVHTLRLMLMQKARLLTIACLMKLFESNTKDGYRLLLVALKDVKDLKNVCLLLNIVFKTFLQIAATHEIETFDNKILILVVE